MSQLREFLKNMKQRKEASADIKKEVDLLRLTNKVEGCVENFLVSNNMVSGKISKTQAVASNESFAPELIASQIGIDGIESLVREAGIPEHYVQAASEQIGIILFRHIGHNPSSAWSEQSMSAESMDNHNTGRSLNTIYPESIANDFANRLAPSQESFGTNINMAIPDMKLAITVAIMRFHTGLTPRVLPVRGTSDPMIQYIKSRLEVYDLSSVDTQPKRLVDLYEDPTMVKNQLQQIVPRKANDEVGAASMLVADGILRFGMKANLLKLSIDPDVFGHTKINWTDIVADGAKAKSIIFELNDGTNPAEQFEISIPSTLSRLTRPSNAKDSADRNADLEYATFLNKESKNTTGAVSTILAAFTSLDEGLAVRFFFKPSINLKRGIAHALCSLEIKAHNRVDMAQLSAGAISAAAGMTTTLIGYTLDAKFSEENIRKSNIAIRTHRQPFSYDIPTGRNYIYDYAIGQNNPEENAANLTKVIRIGQDDVVLKVIRETLGFVYDQIELFNGKALDDSLNPGRDYVAGDMVRPYVFIDTLDISQIQSVRSADRSGDIKQFLLTYLTAVMEKMMNVTFYKQQLADGAPVTFKLLTNNPMLGNIIGARHIHNHLDNHDARGTDGSEYKLVLDSGVVLEVVTSTFNYMQNVMILIPCIKESPESVLNFGHNWDYGTMVAHYTPGLSGDASHHRLFANARELPIPTNPIGAIIDVQGMDTVCFLDIPTSP